MVTSKYQDGVIVYRHETRPPRPVAVTQSTLDKLKELMKQLAEHPADYDIILPVFCQNNPDVVTYIKNAALGVAFVLVVGTLVEDILTGGSGIADDWASFIAAQKLVRFAMAL